MQAFRKCFPKSTQRNIEAFASKVTTRAGNGLVSKIQIESFLYKDDRDVGDASVEQGSLKEENKKRRFSSPTEAVEACEGRLVNISKKPRPMPSPPSRISAWIHKALVHEDKRFARYSRKFIEARLSTRNAVLAEPLLEIEDLKSLGVDKLGDQRKIMQFLRRLRDGGDDGVLKKGDVLTCAFGSGVVVQHRNDDDMYKIDLRWGTLFAFEEKCSIQRRKSLDSSTDLKKIKDTGNAATLLKNRLAATHKVQEDMLQNHIFGTNGLQAQEYKEH